MGFPELIPRQISTLHPWTDVAVGFVPGARHCVTLQMLVVLEPHFQKGNLSNYPLQKTGVFISGCATVYFGKFFFNYRSSLNCQGTFSTE
jgi:hypothetical protein